MEIQSPPIWSEQRSIHILKTHEASGVHTEEAGNQMLCRVEEHQHQLAHQCSPNIIGIWEWGICGLMGGAFIT